MCKSQWNSLLAKVSTQTFQWETTPMEFVVFVVHLLMMDKKENLVSFKNFQEYCLEKSKLQTWVMSWSTTLHEISCVQQKVGLILYSKIPILSPTLELSKSGLKDHFWSPKGGL